MAQKPRRSRTKKSCFQETKLVLIICSNTKWKRLKKALRQHLSSIMPNIPYLLFSHSKSHSFSLARILDAVKIWGFRFLYSDKSYIYILGKTGFLLSLALFRSYLDSHIVRATTHAYMCNITNQWKKMSLIWERTRDKTGMERDR